MIELFLIRHGEAVGQGTYLGRRSDPPLSRNGRAQVVALKSMLPLTEGRRLYSSPMKRARETAELLFDDLKDCRDLTVIDELAEMDFGEWDGLSWQEISAVADSEYRAWLDDPLGQSPPGGENLHDFNARVKQVLKSVIGDDLRGGDEKIFITAHGGVIRSILCSLLELPAEKHLSFKIDPASISCVKIFTESDAGQNSCIEYLNLKAYR